MPRTPMMRPDQQAKACRHKKRDVVAGEGAVGGVLDEGAADRDGERTWVVPEQRDGLIET